MKKISALMGTIGMLFATNLYAAFDGTITLTQVAPIGPNGGGQFTAVTSTLGTFQTFCVEINEEFNPGTQYNYIINTGAVSGDTGDDAYNQRPLSGLPATSGPFNMDNVSLGTAWLYSQFRAGTLTDNSGNAYNTLANQGTLQMAIWYLEDEGDPLNANNSLVGDQSGNTFVLKAKNALSKTLAQIEADSNGAYGVKVLNIYDNSNGFHQDQLAIVPEPTTVVAGALLLLPFGVGMLRILRKNRAS